MNHQGKHHFSHEHMLIPIELDEGEEIKCKACEILVNGKVNRCTTCQYYLHEHCYDAPRSMDHPAHPDHPLALTLIPTYASCAYICNACGYIGKSFSFSCAKCEFDLHLLCADLPQTFLFEKEHPHELKLIFERPMINDDRVVTISCYICNDEEQVSWLYCCEVCEYVVHMSCLFAKYEREEMEDEESKVVVSVEGVESSFGVRQQEPTTEGLLIDAEEDGHDDDDQIRETLSQMPMLGYAIRAYAELLLTDSSDDDDDDDDDDEDDDDDKGDAVRT